MRALSAEIIQKAEFSIEKLNFLGQDTKKAEKASKGSKKLKSRTPKKLKKLPRGPKS